MADIKETIDSAAEDVKKDIDRTRESINEQYGKKRLVRPKQGRMIAGVAAAFARYFGIDVTIVRLVWVFLLIPGGFPGIIPYIICWIVIPSEE